MKKTIILCLALLLTAIFYLASGKSIEVSSTTEDPEHITTLIIDANVTVVLVNNNKATLQVIGGNGLIDPVTLTKTGDTLRISSVKKRNYIESRVIYVPANKLRHIRINSAAHVSSLHALRIPKLDVVINGACKVNIANIGELNFIDTDSYYFEQSREVRQIPAGLL